MSSPRKVLVVTSTFPQWEGDPRGAFIRTHWERQAGDGCKVTLLVPMTAWVRGELESPLRVQRFRYAPRSLSTLCGNFGILENIRANRWRAALIPAFWLSLRRALARALATGACDRVVAHMLLPAGWEVARICQRRGIPFSLYGHGTDVDLLLRLGEPARRLFERRIQGADAVHFPSAEKRDRFRDAMGTAGPLPPLMVEDMAHCVPVPTRAPRPNRGRSVLYLGRLTRQKAVDTLLRAVASMESPPQLDIAGDGPERAALEGLARTLGVDARFHGFVSGAPKEQLMDHAGVLCVPSRELPGGFSEGAPLVVKEALAHGLRVVATRVGGIPELCAGQPSTTLVAPDQPLRLAQALARALAGQGDEPFGNVANVG